MFHQASKRRIASDAGPAVPKARATAPAASPAARTETYMHLAEIAALLPDVHEKGMASHQVHEAFESRGHYCSRSTVFRYLMCMEKVGLVQREFRRYRLRVRRPASDSSSPPG